MKKVKLTRQDYHKNAQIYGLMANPKRLEILNLLTEREFTVSELSETMKVRVSNLSQHLTLLRLNNLVKVRKNGQKAHYSIVDPLIVAPCKILKTLKKKGVGYK